MLAQKVKQCFIVALIIVGVFLFVNIWEQAATGQVNGSIQWILASVAGAAVTFTYAFAKYAARKGENTKWVGRYLLLMIVLSLVFIEVATIIWGFTPQGWTY